MDLRLITQNFKLKAFELGFQNCGISKAEFLENEAPRLENWLKAHRHGEMSYMENNFDMRLDPRKLVDNAKSVVSLSFNYFPENEKSSEFKVSKYAYGRDYHKVIKKKLFLLLDWLKNEIGAVEGRAFVDSAPILEKAWAQKSGIGWLGKNDNLITKQHGSFYFLAEIIIDTELDYSSEIQTDHCGTCTKCIDACPTQAIVEPYQVDGSRCISYLTIELKNEIPSSFLGKMDNWVFGCDVCQDVCPWNRFSKPHEETDFTPKSLFTDMTTKDWIEMTEDVFDKIFEGTPVKRTKYKGIKRNVDFIRKL